MDFKDKIQDSPILDVMKNTGVKNITKYTRGRKPLSGYISGTPVHVKSAINYNDMLHHLGVNKRKKVVPEIKNADKIKWAYLRHNAMGFDTIALRGYEDPSQITEFVEEYIDRNKIFDREIRGKLDDFYAAMNWDKLPANNNMNKFFSFG
jgi:hypothetical protein